MKGKLTCKSEIPCLVGPNKELFIDDISKAREFNKFFASVYIQDDRRQVQLSKQVNNSLSRVRF